MKIIIENERMPSWNGDYAGRHWSARNAIAAEKHLLVRSQIDPDIQPFDKPVAITMIATYKDHPVDSCNMMAKLYTDGLIGWAIHDDDLRYVVKITTIPRLGDMNQVEIIIEEVEELS